MTEDSLDGLAKLQILWVFPLVLDYVIPGPVSALLLCDCLLSNTWFKLWHKFSILISCVPFNPLHNVHLENLFIFTMIFLMKFQTFLEFWKETD